VDRRDVSEKFKKYEFGAVSRVKMIEHLDNTARIAPDQVVVER
jgi:hypothetical protein